MKGVEGNRDILAVVYARDVAQDILAAVLDNQVAIEDSVDWVADNQVYFHLATRVVDIDHVAVDAVDASLAVALDNHQATSDTTYLHSADSNYHSFISTCFRHNETDRYVVSQYRYTPSGIFAHSIENLLRIVCRRMLGRTRIHCVEMSIHT